MLSSSTKARCHRMQIVPNLQQQLIKIEVAAEIANPFEDAALRD